MGVESDSSCVGKGGEVVLASSPKRSVSEAHGPERWFDQMSLGTRLSPVGVGEEVGDVKGRTPHDYRVSVL